MKKRSFLNFFSAALIFLLFAALSCPALGALSSDEKPVSITECSVKIAESVPYTGKRIKPQVTVSYGKRTLENGTDYTLAYNNNKSVGKAGVTVKGVPESGFSGSKTVHFNIIPRKLQQLRASKKTQTSVTLTWEKRGKGIGFVIYSYNKSTKSYTRLAGVKTNEVKLCNLQPNTVYRFSVRASKRVNGKNFRSAYSAPIKVRTEKVKYSKMGRIIIDTEGQDWKLLVVNSTREYPKDYSPSVSYVLNSGARLDKRVTPYYVKMYNAAKKDGVTLTPYSGYRSYAHQEWNYNNLTSVYMKQFGLNRADAAKRAAKVILPPGTSEHSLGLAMDICNTLNSFRNTKEYAWLCKNADKYGFILRYPKKDQAVTGVMYEPWHWRFVGIKNAKAIKKSGLCLEDYLDSVGIIY